MDTFIFLLSLKNKKTRFSLLSVILMASSVNADKNWIPIEPINATRDSKQKPALDINLSKTQPLIQLIEKAKIIQELLNERNKEEKLDTQNGKNWYPLD